MKRCYVYIPENGSNCRKRHEIPLARKPDRVWTMLKYDNPNEPPPKDIPLIHWETAFIEDRLHDWDWSEKEPEYIRYCSRITEGGIWICLLYKEIEK